MSLKMDRTLLTSVSHQVSQELRRHRYGHAGGVIWLTGLSGSGKSTLAMGLEARLLALGYACYTLDGDNVRHGLNADLGFLPQDRAENIRRVGDDTAVSGQLTVTDPDAGEAQFTAQTDVDGQYGTFSIGTDGQWTYTPDDRADALNTGDTQQEPNHLYEQ